MSIQGFECRQYFLYQWAIFGAEHLHLWLQRESQHITVITHEVELLDIQLFKYLPGETEQCLNHLWPIAEVNAESSFPVDAAHQVLIHLFHRKWHERG